MDQVRNVSDNVIIYIPVYEYMDIVTLCYDIF